MKAKMLIRLIVLFAAFHTVGSWGLGGAEACAATLADVPDSCYISTLPYVESFHNCTINAPVYAIDTNFFLPCWGRMTGSATEAVSGLVLYRTFSDTMIYITESSNQTQYVVLPPLADSLLYVDSLYMHLNYYTNQSSTPNRPQVGAMTDPRDTSSFRLIAELPEVYFSDIAVSISSLGAGEYIAIRFHPDSYQYMQLKDVIVDRMPMCGVVYNVQNSRTGMDASYVRWDHLARGDGELTGGDSVTFTVRAYEDEPTGTGSTTSRLVSTVVTQKHFALLGGMQPNRSYRVTITTECGEEPDTITAPAIVPYSCSTVRTVLTCRVPLVVIDEEDDDNDESATLLWSGAPGDSVWNIYMRDESINTYGNWQLVAAEYHGNSYTIPNIPQGSRIGFRVNPQCNLTEANTYFNTVYMVTACRPVEVLPWVEDFEHFNKNCWLTNPSSTPSVTSRMDGRALNINYHDYTGRLYRYYMLPEFATPIDSLTVSGELYGDGMIVGVASNTNQRWQFTPIDTVLNTSDSTWESFTVDLSSSPYSSGRIYLSRYNISSSSGIRPAISNMVDNLRVERLTECHIPTHVLDSAVTNHSAIIKWRASEGALVYEVEYGLHGFVHGEGMSAYVLANHATLVGLDFGIPYDVYVRAYCNTGDTSEWSFPIMFTTQCGDISSLPWSEYIDRRYQSMTRNDVLPCWSRNYSTLLNIEKVKMPEGDSILGLYIGHGAYSREMVSMPRLTTLNQARYLQARLSVWAEHVAGTPVEAEPSIWLEVGVSTLPASTYGYTPIDTLPLTYEPTEHEVSFANYTGSGRYITTNLIGNYPYHVYMNYAEVDMAPYCLRPDRLRVSDNRTTQALLDWRERGEAGMWQIAYRIRGNDEETMVTANSRPFVLTGLTPGTEYEFRVRSLCSEGDPTVASDTSEWSFERQKFFTLTLPAGVPYHCDFEDTVESRQWVAMSNNFYFWRQTSVDPGDTNHGYMIDFNRSVTNYYTPYTHIITNSVLFRDVDFGPRDSTGTAIIQRYSIGFRAKSTGAQGSFTLRVYLADTEELPILTNVYRDPLWEVDSQYLLAELEVDDSWQPYYLPLDSVFGIHRLAFVMSNYSTIMQMCIDDVEIVADPCPRPFGLHADSISDSSATIGWLGTPTARYVVNWGTAELPTAHSDTVVGNTLSLTGLTPLERYSVQVALLCDTDLHSSMSVPLLFTTLLCDSLRCDSVLMDTTQSQLSNVLPVSQSEQYSYSQQLFPSNVFAGAGSITAVNLNYQLSCTDNDTNSYTIYMGHTNKQYFADANDFIDPTELSIVYDGPLPQGEGWNKIVLESPFPFDGIHNVVLTIGNNANTAKPANNLLGSTTLNTIIELRGNSPIEPASLDALRRYTGNRNTMAFRSQAVFDFCPECACERPELLPPDLRHQRATVQWRSTAAGGYELAFRPFDEPAWGASTFTTDTFMTLHNLTPGTPYIYRVRSVCPEGQPQYWIYGLFKLLLGTCPPPQNLLVADLAPEEVTLQWDLDEDLDLYYLNLFNTTFDTTVITSENHVTLNTLLHGVTYNAAVHATCANVENPGLWSDTISFTTLTCPDATDLTYTDLGSTSVVLDWNSPDTVEAWEVSYGNHGFHNEQGSTAIATSHPYRLTGLESQKEYDVYVRSLCGEGFHSEHWSEHVTFTTRSAGIAPPDEPGSFVLTPNPAKTHFTVTLTQSLAGSVLITVRDAHGHTVCQSNAVGTPIVTKGWPAGIYFVTLTTPLSSSTQKIIVE